MKNALLCLIMMGVFVCSANAAPQVVDSYYRPDVQFPDYAKYWRFQSNPATLAAGYIGGTLQLYVQNKGSKQISVTDICLDGVSLEKAVPFSTIRKYRKYLYSASISYSKLPKEQIDRVVAAGEPAWWRFEPKTLKPGEIGELILRVRKKPVSNSVRLKVMFNDGKSVEAVISTEKVVPRIEGISFSPGRGQIYIYVSHPTPGTSPKRVLMDGVDITSSAIIACDTNSSVSPIVCMLKKPADYASLHCFSVGFSNGDKVTASVRAFDDGFAYGMWGAASGDSSEVDIAKAYLKDLADHNINVQMEQIGSAALADFMKTKEGLALLKKLGISRMVYEVGKGNMTDPWAYFLTDEPDAGDSKIMEIPAKSQIGSLGNGLVARTFELRKADPKTPQLLNMNYTLPPDNWYTYGQVADIMTADPYYQGSIVEETNRGKSPEKLSLFKKATYIDGVSRICQSSQAPRMLNMLLFTGRPESETGNFRYATPEEKRIEAYYCIGNGSKGISWWWFHCLEEGLAPETSNPVALAQWREIGLLGAELRTAGPVIMTSCPAQIPVNAPKELWTRVLLHGNDTLVLICVNDDYTCDLNGINIKPLQDVKVSVDLPKWLEAKSVFELSYKGTADLSAECAKGKASLSLGIVDVSRMIFITSDPTLKSKLQKLYDSKFAKKVASLTVAK